MNRNYDQLPFNPEQPQTGFFNISLNNPPFVPQYNGDQRIQNIAPFVSAMIALEIQNNINKSQLRIFMFNQYSQNAFANQDFSTLVVNTLDYIAACMFNNMYNDIEQAARDIVPKMVTMLCAANTDIFPGLRKYVDPSLQNDIRGTIASLGQVSDAINRMRNQNSNQNNYNSSGYDRSNPPGGWNQQDNRQPIFGGNRSALPSGGGNGGIALFGGGQTHTQHQGHTMAGTKYSNDNSVQSNGNRDFPVKQPFNPVVKEEVAMQQNNLSSEVLVSACSMAWKPTVKQPYFPAYNPVTHELFYITDANGVIIEATLKERTTPVMEYERHAIKTVFGPVSKNVDFSNTKPVQAKINLGIVALNNALEAINEGNATTADSKITTFIKEKVIAETSLTTAWFAGSLCRMQVDKNDMPYVYRVFASVATPTVSDVDETNYIKDFGSAKTFIELREKLNSSTEEVSRELWNSVNKKMTALINRLLKQNMSIPGLKIDSFVIDIQEVIEYLNEVYGASIQEAFLKNQRHHIEAAFRLMYDESAEGFTAYFKDDLKFATEPKITYMTTDYCLTYLNAASYELELELSANSSAAVVKNICPMMYDLVKAMFDYNDDRITQFDRFLIRTNDGYVMEACRGAIGNGFYLLTLVE